MQYIVITQDKEVERKKDKKIFNILKFVNVENGDIGEFILNKDKYNELFPDGIEVNQKATILGLSVQADWFRQGKYCLLKEIER